MSYECEIIQDESHYLSVIASNNWWLLGANWVGQPKDFLKELKKNCANTNKMTSNKQACLCFNE